MKKIRIVLIEDDQYDAAITVRNLEKEGSFEVRWHSSLKEASSDLIAGNMDAVLLDLNLPDCRGTKGIQSLREVNRDVPIIILSGLSDTKVIEELLASGAQDFVIKGVTDNILPFSIRNSIERQKQVNSLKEAELKAMSASTAKHMFLVNMSHEFRTPLTAILGFIDILSDAPLDPYQKSALAAIHRNGIHLMQLVNNVIDIGKIEANHLNPTTDKVSLQDIISDIEATFVLRASELRLKFSVDAEFPLPKFIFTDALRVKQILFNILGNAFKFTEPGGLITLTLRYDDLTRQLDFAVTDSGAGICEADQARLFQPFEQVDMTAARTYSGAGLGLAISRRLARLLGGDIQLDSKEGEGSTFTLTIPTGVKNEGEFLSELESRTFQEIIESEEEPPALDDKRILVVDDLEDNRDLLSFYLSLCQCDVDVAVDGVDALNKVQEIDFDLILLDMQMPRLNGYQSVRQMRQDGVQTPVVALTASALEGSEGRCIMAGCDAYICKPFTKEKLFSVLSDFLKNNSKPEMIATPPGAELTQRRTLDFDNASFEDGLKPIKRQFIRNLPERLAALDEALENMDYSRLEYLTHKIAGAAMFGCDELGRASRDFEKDIQDKNWSNFRTHISAIRQECDKLFTTLSKD